MVTILFVMLFATAHADTEPIRWTPTFTMALTAATTPDLPMVLAPRASDPISNPSPVAPVDDERLHAASRLHRTGRTTAVVGIVLTVVAFPTFVIASNEWLFQLAVVSLIGTGVGAIMVIAGGVAWGIGKARVNRLQGSVRVVPQIRHDGGGATLLGRF